MCFLNIKVVYICHNIYHIGLVQYSAQINVNISALVDVMLFQEEVSDYSIVSLLALVYMASCRDIKSSTKVKALKSKHYRFALNSDDDHYPLKSLGAVVGNGRQAFIASTWRARARVIRASTGAVLENMA